MKSHTTSYNSSPQNIIQSNHIYRLITIPFGNQESGVITFGTTVESKTLPSASHPLLPWQDKCASQVAYWPGLLLALCVLDFCCGLINMYLGISWRWVIL
ncbi:hypothetical protein CDAR_17471 [Caerostris darwini]|uniref:Uncharacterized protein n=1 Tax=Caerostris darwini TaxID=1538125 RepID=A0AAV4VFC4_9ARAC|nr:hypothetical protein CDAR_17471 [Caerostris darwini]